MNAATSLAEIAVTHPSAARVFYEHHLDFCCGGRRSLEDACLERGLDWRDILDGIAARERFDPDPPRWDVQPLSALVDHIVRTYHQRLRRDLPLFIEMARKVEARHADKPGCPRGLVDELTEIHATVLDHLAKEEQTLFPMIVRGMGAQASGPVHVMEVEHEHHREHLLRLRALTNNLTPPNIACTTWRALYAGLEQLEQDLMNHIHLENNVLFPRALAG
jgi:regulator of cell morphogenesis and NO signaling